MWLFKWYFPLSILLFVVKCEVTFAIDELPMDIADGNESKNFTSTGTNRSGSSDEQDIIQSYIEEERKNNTTDVDDLIDSIVNDAVNELPQQESEPVSTDTEHNVINESNETRQPSETVPDVEKVTVETSKTVPSTGAWSSTHDGVDEVIDLDEVDKKAENTTRIDISKSVPTQKAQLVVEDYLTTLSDKELENVCVERGFDVKVPPPDSDSDARHLHYVEAAQRCLRLDDEINAVIAKNPDLAAELEAEVERMRLEKERLTKEREEMLAEKALLEQQLLDAGIRITPNGTVSFDKDNSAASSMENTVSEPETILEVLQESFRLLWLRVYQDIQLVQSIANQVLKPILNLIQIVWRYSRPTVNSIAKMVVVKIVQLTKIEQVQVFIKSLTSPTTILWTNTILPVVTSIIKASKSFLTSLRNNELTTQLIAPLTPYLKPVIKKVFEMRTLLEENLTKMKVALSEWIRQTLEDM